MREYLYVEQLAALSPWSPSEIHDKIDRGVFRKGVHYFQPQGRRTRIIFRWSAVVDYIENNKPLPEPQPRRGRGFQFDAEKAQTALSRMLAQSGR